MKRHNLISLISVILIMLVGMAMTGCATIPTTPLMQAVEKGDINTVKQLLDKGVDLNEIGYADRDITIREITINKNITMTALAFAAWKGHTNVVKLLLDKGADINAVDDHGYTPLRSAIYKGHTDIVKMLLDKGADIETGMSFRYRVGAGSPFSPSRYPIANITPLALAVLKGHANVVKILIDRGADVDIATSLLVPIAAGTDSNDTPVSARAGLKILEMMAKGVRAKKYQAAPSAHPSALPTALPLPTESAEPF
ncbi:MAG: ankyrin repeat domain-containing protein [Rectinemataceae bacterium]|nr:ankyrin repeat domain-containing protein [Rectinemataceae bacterium]